MPPFSDLSISVKDPKCRLEPLNKYQNDAVTDALVKPFSLIQGPPGMSYIVNLPKSNLNSEQRSLHGYIQVRVFDCLFVRIESPQSNYVFLISGTGKTVTGAHIAYWFAYQNGKTISQPDQNSIESDKANKLIPSSQVIYCGPSNKSIDVVASK